MAAEWWPVLVGFLGVLAFFLLIGLPVAFSFLCANLVMVGFVYGWTAGLQQLVLSMYQGSTNFSLTAVPAFIILGELLFRSGLAARMIDVVSQFLGRLPGRLSVLSVVCGTMFAALSGSTIANTSMLGSMLVPEMRKRGYQKQMAMGPILGSGTLAMLIPPSAMAVLLGSIANISIGGLLIAGIVPGLLLAVIFLVYIVIRCTLDPTLAPPYDVERATGKSRWREVVVNAVPATILIGLVVGTIFAGLATPTEAASMGAVGAFLIVAAYGLLTRKVLVESALSTVKITGMIMLILAASTGFSQLLAFSGATAGIISIVTSWGLGETGLVLIMALVIIILGSFLDAISILMITMPMFMPLVSVLDINAIWFGIIALVAVDLGNLTPPFGFSLFVMKGVAPADISMTDVYRAAFPYVLLEMAAILMIVFVPAIALWLPSVGGL